MLRKVRLVAGVRGSRGPRAVLNLHLCVRRSPVSSGVVMKTLLRKPKGLQGAPSPLVGPWKTRRFHKDSSCPRFSYSHPRAAAARAAAVSAAAATAVARAVPVARGHPSTLVP